MDDLISRQAAIKEIEDLPNCYNGYSDTYDKAYIIGVLEELPTIDPVRRGRWELEEEQRHVELIYSCSECGCIAWGNEEISNYCPNCGAKMEGEDE